MDTKMVKTKTVFQINSNVRNNENVSYSRYRTFIFIKSFLIFLVILEITYLFTMRFSALMYLFKNKFLSSVILPVVEI